MGEYNIAGAKSSQAANTRDKYRNHILQGEPAVHASYCHTKFIWLQADDRYQSVHIWIQSIKKTQIAV